MFIHTYVHTYIHYTLYCEVPSIQAACFHLLVRETRERSALLFVLLFCLFFFGVVFLFYSVFCFLFFVVFFFVCVRKIHGKHGLQRHCTCTCASEEHRRPQQHGGHSKRPHDDGFLAEGTFKKLGLLLRSLWFRFLFVCLVTGRTTAALIVIKKLLCVFLHDAGFIQFSTYNTLRPVS